MNSVSLPVYVTTDRLKKAKMNTLSKGIVSIFSSRNDR